MPGKLQYQTVNAFTSKPYSGKPAGVVILDGKSNPSSLSDEHMLLIAREINCPETAFLIPAEKLGCFGLRWFTPTVEVNLCGHATIASTAVLSSHELYAGAEEYTFDTLSGTLKAIRIQRSDGEEAYELDFPDDVPSPNQEALEDEQFTGPLRSALGDKYSLVRNVWSSGKLGTIIEVELDQGDRLQDWDIDIGYIAQIKMEAVTITTLNVTNGTVGPDFDTRMFGPDVGIPEDPVTGSLHCVLAPLYSKKLNVKPKTELHATQGGSRRGELSMVWKEEEGRVLLRGQAVLMAKGEMPLP